MVQNLCLQEDDYSKQKGQGFIKKKPQGGAKVEFILFRGGDYRANQITDWYYSRCYLSLVNVHVQQHADDSNAVLIFLGNTTVCLINILEFFCIPVHRFNEFTKHRQLVYLRLLSIMTTSYLSPSWAQPDLRVCLAPNAMVGLRPTRYALRSTFVHRGVRKIKFLAFRRFSILAIFHCFVTLQRSLSVCAEAVKA